MSKRENIECHAPKSHLSQVQNVIPFPILLSVCPAHIVTNGTQFCRAVHALESESKSRSVMTESWTPHTVCGILQARILSFLVPLGIFSIWTQLKIPNGTRNEDGRFCRPQLRPRTAKYINKCFKSCVTPKQCCTTHSPSCR